MYDRIFDRYLAAKKEVENSYCNPCFVILLLISYAILIVLFGLIGQYNDEAKFECIYYMSKMLTIKAIIVNNHRSELLDSFYNSDETTTLPMTYRNLLRLVKDKNECVTNYRPCGILDTYGNVLCVEEFVPCPINKLKITHVNAAEEYLSRNYKTTPLNNISTNYQFFYSNEFNKGNGVVMIIKTKDDPKFINVNNFVLDSNTYIEFYEDDAEILKGISNFFGGKIFGNEVIELFINIFQVVKDFEDQISIIDLALKGAKLYADVIISIANLAEKKDIKEFEKFVKKKIEILDEKNNDIYFEHIGDNYYAKNYIGFKSVENIEKFLRFDFGIYKKIFPSFIVSEIAFYFFLILVFFFGFFLGLFLCKPKFTKFNWSIAIIASIINIVPSLGFFIYGLVNYVNVNKSETLDDLKSIESDEFIKGIIKDFIEEFKNVKLLIVTLCIIPVSWIFYVCSMIQYCLAKQEL